MLHSDIISEQECDGELIDISESKYVTKTWCSSCGTEFTYVPDCSWVKIVTPGMRIDRSI